MSFNRVAVGLLLGAAGIGGALACGPNFPWQLLGDRAETVSQRIELNFASEASRLLTVPNDGLRVVEGNEVGEKETVAAERAEAVSGAWRGLMPALPDDVVLARLEAARRADNGEAALAAAAGLPVAVAEYIAGAVEFGAGHFDKALAHFQAIERLPSEQRKIRAVIAAYMRGRIHQIQGEFAPARAAFQAARRYAEAGAPDPLGLAVTSLGEEARLDLLEAGFLESPWPLPASDPDDATVARLIASAVRLYSDQAARGSKMALLSLGEVARRLMRQDRQLKLAVADPLARRMLVAWLASMERGYSWDEQGNPTPSAVTAVIDAILSQPTPSPGPDLDRLAAVAYQGGRYDAAERLVAATTQPLGLWVRAKLALRRGDRDAAVRDWTAALTGAEQGGGAALDGQAGRLRGELAVMRLSQGEYRDSLKLLFPVAGGYWGDVIYIAERVLTVDELKTFVDGLPPAPPTPPDQNVSIWSESFSPVTGLRGLLGRRLVREGRVAEALAYFPAQEPKAAQQERDGNRAYADDVRDYLAAIEAARPPSFEWPWQRVRRAEAMFWLATKTRVQGMGLMGTEGPPDEWVLSGLFSYGYGQSSLDHLSAASKALLGPDEAKRFAASAPRPNVRYHYRGIASDQAVAAADLLPQRSQAYAAVLCWAARFAIDSGDQEKATAIYKRYVATGAYQSWASEFGWACVDPDFEGARSFWQRRAMTWIKQMSGAAWRHSGLLAAVVLVVGGIVVAAGWSRRRLRGF